jgi:hypothetical protein
LNRSTHGTRSPALQEIGSPARPKLSALHYFARADSYVA